MAGNRTLTPYLNSEYQTIRAMTRIYCRAHHKELTSRPCADCEAFLAFAKKKLILCPYGDEKPACSKCEIHCYGQKKRQQAKNIMRYACPRMLLCHPIMAIKHWLKT